jgi:eukaryotic-like serine/threonine-protein kinase
MDGLETATSRGTGVHVEELVFGRRYRATEKIGSGGMAEVYKAVDEVLGRTVAVKVLHPRYAADPGFVARFRQEAQAAANLSHPAIVNIYDWGRDDETYYIVMEYVRGTDLKAVIEQQGPVDPMKAAEYASQVCSALAVAHGYDIIHRDIKPHNIVLAPTAA